MSVSSNYRVNYQLKSHRRDQLIEFIKSLLLTPFVLESNHGPLTKDPSNGAILVLKKKFLEVFQKIEDLILEHIQTQKSGGTQTSKLSDLVPTIGYFFSPLPLVQAFDEYDQLYRVTSRRFIPPSFNDVRHILNRAQAHAISDKIKLISFDADQTIYNDGKNLENGSEICQKIISLLSHGLHVVIVTAASYPDNPGRYETRLAGLLHAFQESGLPASVSSRFHVLGGECSYLFRFEEGRLVQVPAQEFQLPEMLEWKERAIQQLIDVAQESLDQSISALNMPVQLYRKARSVGFFNLSNKKIPREQLEEVALAAQYAISQSGIEIPFCAFNGGSDVWVDVGNKHYGVKALQVYFNTQPDEVVHIGDQFLSIGNDFATRRACSTLWIADPTETVEILSVLLADLDARAPPGK